MKRLFITLSLVTFFGVVANAQTVTPKQEKKPDAVQPDGTAKKAGGDEKTVGQERPRNGTRMAITEKGVPASKNKDVKDTKPAANDQKTQPGGKQEKH